MSKYFGWIGAFIALILGWFVKGFFAGKKIDSLTKERDEALVDGEVKKVKIHVKEAELDLNKKQQSKEEVINAQDTTGINSGLDNMFK
jgi:hypothetical protein